jgi:hypothetical protein
MAEPDKPVLTTAEQQQLTDAWAESVVQDQDAEIQALIAGLNFRVDIVKAFKAAWITAKIYFTGQRIMMVGTTNPIEVIGIATDVDNLVVTTLDALRERMLPLEYTACVVLSSSPDGMTEQEFKQRLTEFLVLDEGAELPWYLGLTRGHLQDSLAALQAKDGFINLMNLLRKNDWLLEESGKVKFKPRHYRWGLSLS